jgi:alkylation response protein AidB-like acyl-CoA dehydrogenase
MIATGHAIHPYDRSQSDDGPRPDSVDGQVWRAVAERQGRDAQLLGLPLVRRSSRSRHPGAWRDGIFPTQTFEHIYRHHRHYRITEGTEEIQLRRAAGHLFGFMDLKEGYGA